MKLPGHNRNEALDCRNYANAAFRAMNPDLERLYQKINDIKPKPTYKKIVRKKQPQRRMREEDW